MTAIQETPQIFTLILLLGLLASLFVFAIVAYWLIRGRRSSAFRLLSRWLACAVLYLVISVVFSLLRPTRIIEQGQYWCFDDWCIAVEAVHLRTSPGGNDLIVTTDMRIYNDARLPESAQGFWAYLRDENDRHYAPIPGPWQDVIASRVPGHSIARTSMDFVVPKDARLRGFVTNHGSGTPCGILPSLLEIGQGTCLFHRQNMIRIALPPT